MASLGKLVQKAMCRTMRHLVDGSEDLNKLCRRSGPVKYEGEEIKDKAYHLKITNEFLDKIWQEANELDEKEVEAFKDNEDCTAISK